MSNKITNKKSKIFKIKIFYFTLGILVCSLVGVSAATYFESNAVTYDNTESGLNSTDVQGAIDELYNECFPPVLTLGDYILDNVDIVTSGDGLYEDEYEDGRFIFKGGNPNNYITFNNEKAGWRIISVEPDKTIKIMKTASIGNQFWNSNGSNNWASPATLNIYLNGTYYNGLTSTAQGQIIAKEWSIGAVTEDNNDLATQIINEKGTKWNGEVAIVTASEYIRTNSNKSSCGSFSLNNDNYRTCRNTTWMYYSNDYWWMLSPAVGYSSHSFEGSSNGNIKAVSVYPSGIVGSHAAVRPALFLSSEVQITGGNGSQNDPYTIK